MSTPPINLLYWLIIVGFWMVSTSPDTLRLLGAVDISPVWIVLLAVTAHFVHPLHTCYCFIFVCDFFPFWPFFVERIMGYLCGLSVLFHSSQYSFFPASNILKGWCKRYHNRHGGLCSRDFSWAQAPPFLPAELHRHNRFSFLRALGNSKCTLSQIWPVPKPNSHFVGFFVACSNWSTCLLYLVCYHDVRGPVCLLVLYHSHCLVTPGCITLSKVLL